MESKEADQYNPDSPLTSEEDLEEFLAKPKAKKRIPAPPAPEPEPEPVPPAARIPLVPKVTSESQRRISSTNTPAANYLPKQSLVKSAVATPTKSAATPVKSVVATKSPATPAQSAKLSLGLPPPPTVLHEYPVAAEPRYTPVIALPAAAAVDLSTPAARKRYFDDKSDRHCALLIEPIPTAPRDKSALELHKQIVSLQTELKSVKEYHLTRINSINAVHESELRSRYQEGLAHGFLNGARAQIETLKSIREELVQNTAALAEQLRRQTEADTRRQNFEAYNRRVNNGPKRPRDE